MKKGIIILVYLAVVLSSPAWSSAATLEVGPSKTYSAIQSAISDATNGDTVLVYDGSYIENINFLGKAISVKSVNGAESTIIDGNENGHVVTFNNNEGLDSVLEGFTIMHGKGTATSVYNDGGGIYGADVSPTINSCVIKSNSAQVGGGGVYLYNSSPRFNNCTITENWTTTEVDFGPGGLMLISSDTTSFPTLTNCSISSNHGGYSGGGIYCSQATLINCTIRNCSAENRFGGLELSSSTMTNCTISGNSSASGSGGIRAYNSHVNNCIITGNSTYYGAGGGIYSVNSHINNCIITGNSAGYGAGGGIYSVNSHINNCIITGNRAKYGGGIYCSGPSTTITNCTISGNEANDADGNGGGIYCEGSSPVIINSILWGNTATLSGNEIYLDGSSTANISYTDIDQDGYAGSNGNIRQDPLITRMPSPGADTVWGTEDDDLGDLHLHPDSPCIDAGTSDNAPLNDIVGTPRPQGAGFDMGAYEYPLTDKIRELVDEYYFDILDREPDQEGLNYWASEIERIMALGINVGEGFQAEVRFFFTCQEYKDKNKTKNEFVTDLYQTFLQREPDAAGLAYWVCQLNRGLTRNMLITTFAYCDEFKAYMTTQFGADTTRPENDLVNDFYRGFLNRFPDDGGFNAWLTQMRQAQCTGPAAVRDLSYQISLLFVNSEEYAGRNRNNAQYAEDLYNAILKRGADPAGFQAWVYKLNNGMTRQQALKFFTNSSEFQGRVDAVIAAGCLP